jgi:hypothetical protein
MRGVTDITGLRDIRSLRTIGRRSIPRVQSSAYLELYMLRKEQDRLEKESALLEKRRKGIRKRLSDIQRQMEDLERSARSDRPDNGGEKAAEPNSPAKRKWKTFALNY